MMRFATSAFLLCLFASANAHFQLLYPQPRGPFVASIEANFCGGYPEVTTSRSTFPLAGGMFKVSSGHPGFTIGAIISTAANPNTFDAFSVNGVQQVVSPATLKADAGTYCVPLNISAAGIPGASDGDDVTVQIVYGSPDGYYYQCADLTLSAALTSPPAEFACT